MGRAGSYRELRVYREAFALAMQVFELACGFPDYETYDLARQIKRSSRSVCANTAEAWRRRRYPAALVAKVVDAEAEAAETRVHIEFAHACGYLPTNVAADLDRRYDRLLARLTAMRTRPEKWVPRQRSAAPPRVAQRRSPHPRAPEKEVDSDRQHSAAAIPTPRPEAPGKEVDSDRQQSPAAPPAQEAATKSPPRPEASRRRAPPSTVEDAVGGSPP